MRCGLHASDHSLEETGQKTSAVQQLPVQARDARAGAELPREVKLVEDLFLVGHVRWKQFPRWIGEICCPTSWKLQIHGYSLQNKRPGMDSLTIIFCARLV